ncbi:TetR family transcriptional regulator, partial [Klebsiella pneumoniae]
DALRVTDYMDTLMLGLSAKAREGDSLPRLLETVRLAGLALERILPA